MGKYRLFLLCFPLFSRLTKDDIEKDIEQQNIRGRIYQYVVDNPGTNFTRILKGVAAGNGTTSYHLHVLETNGFIKSIKKDFKKYYFKTGEVFPYKLQSKLSFIELEILKTLNTSGTLYVGQIAYMIEKSAQTASYSIKQLERKGFVKSYKQNQQKMCTLTRKGEKYLTKHMLDKGNQ